MDDIGERIIRPLPLLALLVGCLLVAVLFRDYGIAWDDTAQRRVGEFVIRWYGSGFTDIAALTAPDAAYGGFFEALSQLATRVSPWPVYDTRHLTTAVFALLGVVATYRIGRLLRGRSAGLVAAAFLGLTPLYFGHAFVNSKDIPFAVLGTISLYYLLKAVREFPGVSVATTLKYAIVTGFAMGIRVGGLLFLCYAALAIGIWWCFQLRNAGAALTWRWLATLATWFAAVTFVAWIAMLVWWPWAQPEPIRRPLLALQMFASFPHDKIMRFRGSWVSSYDLPWSYLPDWLLIQLPEYFLLGLGAAVVALAVYAFGWRNRSRSPQDPTTHAVLATAAFFPGVYATLTGAAFYDGVRQFLFILPPLAVIAGCAAVGAARALPKNFAVLLVGGFALSLLLTVVDLARLHPYEMVYFNRTFGGGLAQAASRYETDYWGLSYREGAEWLAAQAFAPGTKLRVASCSHPASTATFLPANRFDYVGSADYELRSTPDIFLATTRFGCDHHWQGRVLHVVQREGVPLLFIKEARRWSERSSPKAARNH